MSTTVIATVIYKTPVEINGEFKKFDQFAYTVPAGVEVASADVKLMQTST